MKKDFLTELIDELTLLRDEQKKITIPVPPSPAAVMKVIARVAKEHEVTAEDLETMLSMRSVLPNDIGNSVAADAQVVKELKEKE